MGNFIKTLSIILMLIGSFVTFNSWLLNKISGYYIWIYLLGLLVLFAFMYGWGIIVNYYSLITKVTEDNQPKNNQNEDEK